MINEAFI